MNNSKPVVIISMVLQGQGDEAIQADAAQGYNCRG